MSDVRAKQRPQLGPDEPPGLTVERVRPGHYRVTTEDGPAQTVFVAVPPGRRWAFLDGQVFREEALQPAHETGGRAGQRGAGVLQHITAPMPATVLKVLATPGRAVHKGDTLVIVEAMKMELPLRAPADATVVAVRCREGELVQPDALLVELE